MLLTAKRQQTGHAKRQRPHAMLLRTAGLLHRTQQALVRGQLHRWVMQLAAQMARLRRRAWPRKLCARSP